MNVVHQRPDKVYYVLLDAEGMFTILNKYLGVHAIVPTNQAVTSLSVKSASVLFTYGSKVAFLDVEHSKLGAV